MKKITDLVIMLIVFVVIVALVVLGLNITFQRIQHKTNHQNNTRYS